jgi:two-component system response regulator AtoC
MPSTKNCGTLLLAEDDLEVRGYLETALKCMGYSVEVARDGEEVLECLHASATPFVAILLDIVMPRRDGFEALKEIRRQGKDLPVIMISGASSPLNIVEAMKNGADDFVTKPINPEDLRKALKGALENRMRPAPAQPERPTAPANKQIFFGNTPCMRQLQSVIGQIGWSEAPVLIQGETGVGKEMLARELHAQSPRAKKPLLKLNCVALPSELVESELFGYERGAFTGAFQKKPGMFELADGGTIFLDEIGDMDFKLQAKLLQVLQDQEFQRLGGKETVRVDVRVIAATHRNLNKAIAENSFREDLYYRLNVINIQVPPLRERQDDILAIAEFLIRKHTTNGNPPVYLPPSLRELFLSYPWPGNIRELENVIRRFLVLRDADRIQQDLCAGVDHTPATYPAPIPPAPAEHASSTPAIPLPMNLAPAASQNSVSVLEQLTNAKQQAERTAILAALKAKNWNRRQAALLLNVDYKALLYKMNRLSIKKEKAPPPVEKVATAAMG